MTWPTPQQLLHHPDWRRHWLRLWAALMVVVALAALTPGDAGATLSSSDKLDHFLAFGALATAGGLALHKSWRSSLWVALTMLTFGACIELAQTRVPGRYGDWADLVADGVGVMLGLVIVAALRRRWHPARP